MADVWLEPTLTHCLQGIWPFPDGTHQVLATTGRKKLDYSRAGLPAQACSLLIDNLEGGQKQFSLCRNAALELSTD